MHDMKNNYDYKKTVSKMIRAYHEYKKENCNATFQSFLKFLNYAQSDINIISLTINISK